MSLAIGEQAPGAPVDALGTGAATPQISAVVARPHAGFDPALAGMAVTPPRKRIPAGARHGLRYRCRRCDVYGYLAPGEHVTCWACDDGAMVEPR
ncbi:MAG TPA: hypothetical protein VF954_06480 [Acidimicrobiales bacterium]